MRRHLNHVWLVSLASLTVLVLACGGGKKEPLWDPEAPQIDCPGEAVVPLAGQHPMVISFLEIGDLEDGFDLDLDGDPDNKLAAVGSLARSAIEDAFEGFDIIIPFEFFDFASPAADECVKFAIYLGMYRFDRDGDDKETARRNGDCNDHDVDINSNAAEVPGNFKDDDCDGLADETEEAGDAGIIVVPSDDTADHDSDGVTIADGDCDDTNDAVKGPSIAEVCSDGYDNDCDGVADYGFTTEGDPMCSPYDDSADVIGLDPLAFKADGSPVIAFTDGSVVGGAGILKLSAGPSVFSVNIPVTDDLNLDLKISGARIEGDIVEVQGGWALVNGRLGGVLDAYTSDKVRGLDVEEIGLKPEDSLLDATFANILGPILALPSLPDDSEWAGCRTPDIDVDQDGLEAFCDSDPLDDVSTVDVCIDGDGTIVRDEVNASTGEVITNCTEARDSDGKLRFVDGISVEINLDTVPVVLPAELPEL